jgi:hypothetical protein
LYGFKEMGFVGVGCINEGNMVWIREREREMDLWVLRERKKGKRDLEVGVGVGAAMRDGGKKK